LLVYYFALNYFFYYLVGNDALSQLVLNILIFLPLITSVLNSYFLPMLLVQDEKKIYATSLLYSCLSSLVILPIVIINFGLIGAAYMALAIEASKIVFIVILRKKYYVVS
ncbi:hypothetical protein, partial [Vibrio splendidus]|uniref:hypothetical protein n=1 Tax=Vibrio splendidus TaxID=29497 RepID=UPI001A7E06AA